MTSRILATVVVACLALAACSSGEESAAPTETAQAVDSPSPTPAPDSDGDGVPDDEDACPDNPDASRGDDRDCDGAIDSIDYAPDDPEIQGPPDSDGDGVTDDRDDFPDDPDRTEQAFYPSGDPVLDGYPVLVDTDQLDERVARWLDTPQAVAVAPGVYAAYSPAQPDLDAYLDLPNDGDCAVRDLYFPQSGGACWSGVLPGPQEPPL